MIAVGGCYAEAQRERIFELYPDVDVAFGPGSIAHLGDWLGAGGVGVARGRFGLDERDFAATLPMHRERSFQAWVQVSMGCNSTCSYCIVPAVRGREQSRRPGEVVAEVTRLAARGRQGDHAARPERQLVGPRPRARHPHRVRRAPARLRRGRRDRADPLHEPAPEGLPRAGDRRDRRVRRGLRAHPPAAAVGLVADPQGDAPHLHARALPRRSPPACAPRSRTSRSAPTSSSASPARPTPTSSETLEVVEEVGFDSAFTFVYSPRHGTDAATMADQVPHELKIERMERLVERRRSGSRASATPPAIGRVEQVLVEGRRAPTTALLRGRTRRNTTVNFTGDGGAGRARRRRDRGGDLDDAARHARGALVPSP